MSESFDPDNEDRYVASLPYRCHACTAIELRMAEYGEARAPSALSVGVVKKPAARGGRQARA